VALRRDAHINVSGGSDVRHGDLSHV